MKKLILLLSLLTISNNKETKYCDIKGNVTNPGVYEIKDNYTIQDVINIAGGLKNNSYTNNINLSKKVSDEMVIYINTKEEINAIKRLNKCECLPIYNYIECEMVDNNKSTINSKKTTTISTKTIKTTTTSTLKATTIPALKTTTTSTIKITNTTSKLKEEINDNKVNINTCTLEELITIKGLGEKKANNIIEYRKQFGLFNDITEIMNVSGIGESTFNVIKDFIKV